MNIYGLNSYGNLRVDDEASALIGTGRPPRFEAFEGRLDLHCSLLQFRIGQVDVGQFL